MFSSMGTSLSVLWQKWVPPVISSCFRNPQVTLRQGTPAVNLTNKIGA